MQDQPLKLNPTKKYYDLAGQCSAFAAAACRPEAKTTWTGLARKWERLAKEAEKRANEQSPICA